MINMLEDIVDFHRKFGLYPEKPVPHELNPELSAFRRAFMKEELDEYVECCLLNDLEGQLDALVDLVYVALGTAFLHNFPFAEAWARVHAANMKKVRAERSEDSKRGTTYDIVKPPGWKSPVLADLVHKGGANDAS